MKQEETLAKEFLIVDGMRRVEEYNDQFRQPNPAGRYPSCLPGIGPILVKTCERCGLPIKRDNGPCSAVPPEGRWGETWKEKQ